MCLWGYSDLFMQLQGKLQIYSSNFTNVETYLFLTQRVCFKRKKIIIIPCCIIARGLTQRLLTALLSQTEKPCSSSNSSASFFHGRAGKSFNSSPAVKYDTITLRHSACCPEQLEYSETFGETFQQHKRWTENIDIFCYTTEDLILGVLPC